MILDGIYRISQTSKSHKIYRTYNNSHVVTLCGLGVNVKKVIYVTGTLEPECKVCLEKQRVIYEV